MKQLSIFFLLFFNLVIANAQDSSHISIVYLHDGSMIKGQVTEDHSLEAVTIKIIDGTLLTIPLRAVKTIIKLRENIQFLKNGRYVQTSGMYKHISWGTLTTWDETENKRISWGASLFHFVIGHQFNQFLSVGGGFGMDVYDQEVFPVYADFRSYLLNKRVSPYVAVQAGYGFSTDLFNLLDEDLSTKGGIMFHPSIGLRFAAFKKAKFIMEAGYKFQRESITNDRRNTIDKITYRRLALKIGILF